VDCAANCHARGCHLLCHDDVIGTRAVSYIIYLTDPTPIWKDEDGGRLELYDAVPEDDEDEEGNPSSSTSSTSTSSRRRWVPSALPSRTILPEFNALAYFAVRPGVSFHSVQEVFADRPRLSIQGWYHAKGAPRGIEDATLCRLKSSGAGEDTEGDFGPMLPLPGKTTTTTTTTTTSSSGLEDDAGKGDESEGEGEGDDALSTADISFLGRYINPTYLTGASMRAIRERFEEESSVKLRRFLNDGWNGTITQSSSMEDDRDGLGNDGPVLDYRVGAKDGEWRVVGPAHKQRFLEYDGSEGDGKVDDPAAAAGANGPGPTRTTGESLLHLRRSVFQSEAFGRWMGSVTSLGVPLGQRGRVRRFRPGLDYTVAHHGILTQRPVLDATLCFCAGDGEQCAFDEETNDLLGSDDDAMWESGDVGGFECYIAADEDGGKEEEEEEGGGGGGGGGGPADAEYDEEDDTKLLSVSASNNTLSIVYRDPGTMRFVKYVGAGAPSSRWDIAMEYEVDASDDADSSDQHDRDDD
jgi:hypothetical protein